MRTLLIIFLALLMSACTTEGITPQGSGGSPDTKPISTPMKEKPDFAGDSTLVDFPTGAMGDEVVLDDPRRRPCKGPRCKDKNGVDKAGNPTTSPRKEKRD